jgi:hypothetical protein
MLSMVCRGKEPVVHALGRVWPRGPPDRAGIIVDSGCHAYKKSRRLSMKVRHNNIDNYTNVRHSNYDYYTKVRHGFSNKGFAMGGNRACIIKLIN